MKKRFLLCAVTSMLACGSMAAQAAQQFWVTKTADTFNGRCTLQDCSLRDAINAANNASGNNTIGFLWGGTYPIQRQGDGDTEGDFDLLSRITIEGRALDGKTVTIDGQQLDRVFDIHIDAYIALNNLTIINGKRPFINRDWEPGSGGGIKNSGSLFMDSCTLAFNEADGGGDALYNAPVSAQLNATSPIVTITNSNILFNTPISASSVVGGAAVYNDIGARLVIADSTVAYNNSSHEGHGWIGGGIFNIGGGVELYRSKIIHNKGDEGAGITIINGTLDTNIVDSVISDNESDNAAGGVYISSGWSGWNSIPLTFGSGKIVVSGTTIANNKAFGTDDSRGGGGLLVQLEATYRSGIYPSGMVEIVNTTISGNVTHRGGGGLSIFYYKDKVRDTESQLASLKLNNVTITGNKAGQEGGGVFVWHDSHDKEYTMEDTINVQNTIISNNQANGAGPDCFGPIFSKDYNLISNLQDCQLIGATANSIFGVSAQLEPLKDNGGPSPTHALLANSPAIDAGNDATCEVTDQRGVTRPQWQHCDMGAYERTTSPSAGD